MLQRWLWRGGLLLASVAALGICLLLGFNREANRKAVHTRGNGQGLAYGVPIPGPLPSPLLADARPARPDAWRLYLFVYPWCRPCIDELRAMHRAEPHLQGALRVTVVVGGRPAFGSPAAAARGLAREESLQDAMVLDPDDAFKRRCGFGGASPTFLLVDPAGKTRFATSGHVAGAEGSSLVADAMLWRFAGVTSTALPITGLGQWDSVSWTVAGSGARKQDLLKSYRDRLGVLLYLTGDAQRDRALLGMIHQYRRAHRVHFTVVAQRQADMPASLALTRSVTTVLSGNLPVLAATYGIRQGPACIIAWNTRTLTVITGAEISDDVLSQQIGTALLSIERAQLVRTPTPSGKESDQ